MNRVPGQLVAGIDFLPVVDVCFRPILLGSVLRASVCVYTGHPTFIDVELTVTVGYLPYCVIRGEGWAIPFYYHSERRVMVGGMVSRTFPVWCEVLPPPSNFTTRCNTLQLLCF